MSLIVTILSFLGNVFGLKRHTSRLRTETQDTSTEPPSSTNIADAPLCDWYLIGNIVREYEFGEEKIVRSGSKHFTPGTKVYCLPSQWGDGFERVIAAGIRRGSRRWVTVVIKSELVENWRAKRVYSQRILNRLRRGAGEFNSQWKSAEEVEKMANMLNKRNQSRQK